MAQVDILLYSPTEGRVPKGAYQRFLTSLIRRALEQRSLDLAPFIGALPGEHLIFGDPETVLALQRYFNSQGTTNAPQHSPSHEDRGQAAPLQG